MVVHSHTGVDPCILGHQITDLQQDVASFPGDGEEIHSINQTQSQYKDSNMSTPVGT